MKKIYKYNLEVEDSQIVSIPGGEIISVIEQNGSISLYAITDSNKPPIDFEIQIIGTGSNAPISEFNFLDTIKMANGNLIFHIFYRQIKKLLS
jgi:hypothetical protein